MKKSSSNSEKVKADTASQGDIITDNPKDLVESGHGPVAAPDPIQSLDPFLNGL
jgi:hypothetical protein